MYPAYVKEGLDRYEHKVPSRQAERMQEKSNKGHLTPDVQEGTSFQQNALKLAMRSRLRIRGSLQQFGRKLSDRQATDLVMHAQDLIIHMWDRSLPNYPHWQRIRSGPTV